jgi:LPXTG-motif cell wall-anchored protein
VSSDTGGSSGVLWIIIGAAAVAAIGTGIVYTRSRNDPPAER